MPYFSLFDIETIIKTAGYLGIFGIIFTESGLLVGFFLPGDSLLFTAGFLASQKYLNITILALGSFAAAVAGDSFGYVLGRRFGHRVFAREDSFFFHKDQLRRAEDFYKKYGGKTIILARFVPVVRSVAPILAGAGKMNYTTFLFYNIFGGFFWAVGLTTLGFFLGNAIPNIDRYLIPIVAGIIVISVLPGVISILRNSKSRGQVISALRALFKKHHER